MIKLPRFSKRNAHTLLLITDTKTFRIDTDKQGVVVGSLETLSAQCTTTTKLADCLHLIVAGKQRPLGRKVWIFYSRLATAVLSIPSLQLEGVDEATLLQALQFEWEGMTGQSSQEMHLAYTLVSHKDDMSHYWVTQLHQLHLEDISTTLKKAGSQLAGVLHPAGLPLSLANPEQVDWLRLECWPNLLVAHRHQPDMSQDIKLLSFEDRHWHSQLKQWLERQGTISNSETLYSFVNLNIEILPETNYLQHLNDDEPITHWLGLWAECLITKSQRSSPVLQQTTSINQDMLMMVGGGVLAVLLCVAHLSWHLYQSHDYSEKFKALQSVETSITAQRKTLTASQDKRDKLQEKNAKLKGDADILPVLIKGVQQRPSRLLAALAKGRPETLLVEAIRVDKDTVKISGVSLDATSANELASYLTQQLTALGWSIGAPTKQNLELFAEGGPWEFEINLIDLGVEGFNKHAH